MDLDNGHYCIYGRNGVHVSVACLIDGINSDTDLITGRRQPVANTTGT
jgi:hypothetical protein